VMSKALATAAPLNLLVPLKAYRYELIELLIVITTAMV
jgi:hypothetical protein